MSHRSALSRRDFRLPDYYRALYTHVLDRYESRHPPGAFLDELPETLEDSTHYFRKWARW